MRIEVGRGLEPQLTDLMSKLIIENAILPAFRRNDFPGGIKAGVRDIRDVLLGDAEAVKERASSGQALLAGQRHLPLTILVIFISCALSIIWMQSMQTAHPEPRRRDRRRSASTARCPWGSGSSSWGGWSGGGSSDSGGGFSGGGGDFGGGGSSGSW